MDKKTVQDFINTHVEIIKPIFKSSRIAYWNATKTGKEEYYKEYENLQKESEKIFNDKSKFEQLKKFLTIKLNPLLKRQVEILYLSFLASQGDISLLNNIIELSTKIEKEFNTYRAKIDGKSYTDNEIKEILKNEKDSKKLKEAWEASKKQGQLVEKDVLTLVKLRNKLAKSLGFDNYYSFSLHIGEQSENQVFNIFNNLNTLSETAFKKAKEEIDTSLSKEYNLKIADLKPWHYKNLFFQEPPETNIDFDEYYPSNTLKISEKFYKNIGMPVEDILERSDLFERENKYQHAYCMDLDREGDIRSMMNIVDNEKWMETILHELGHAVYWKYINKDLPFILREVPHTLTTEAIAQLFGRQSKNISFIRKYSGKEVNESSAEIRKSLQFRELIFSRWSQVMLNFEFQMYKNPEQNLNKLWWSLVKKYQLINFERDFPDWASKIHLVSSPAYYHNYLLGELLASQIHNHICKAILHQPLENTDYNSKEISKFLIDKIFYSGSTYSWDKHIEVSLGEKLNPKYWVEEFC